MKAGKAVGKVARILPGSGGYLRRKEQEFNDLQATINRLEARNNEWAAEVHELRERDNKRLEILWPVFKEDLIAADYQRKHQVTQSLKRHKPPYTINWVVPPVGSVSGGHAVIMHLIRFLESQGHTCRIYFYDALGESSLAAIKKNMRNHVPIKAEMFYNAKDMAACDAIFATSWQTAYPVYNYKGNAKKFYLLQDFEPMFEPSGTYSALAENTYKLGLHGISTTPFTAEKARKGYGMTTDEIELGIEPSEYYLLNEGPRQKIVFYARPVTPRRGFELGVLALEIFHDRHPEYEINCIGWDLSRYDIPLPYINRGILSTAELNELYNQCAAGLVLSFTSMSLTVVEMMAAGCLPVINNGPDSSLVSYGKYLQTAEPNPVALAERLYEAIESQQKDNAQARAVSEYASTFVWDRYNKALQAILERELG